MKKKVTKISQKITIKPSLEGQIDSLARLVMNSFTSSEDIKKQITYMQ